VKGACHRCHAEVDACVIGVRDVCERCRAYLHCCRNCGFYEAGVHNDCREPNAEVVADKEQGNFCEYFRSSLVPLEVARSAGRPERGLDDGQGGRSATSSTRLAADARKQLEALFRKR
jgi:hypothetical protein